MEMHHLSGTMEIAKLVGKSLYGIGESEEQVMIGTQFAKATLAAYLVASGSVGPGGGLVEANSAEEVLAIAEETRKLVDSVTDKAKEIEAQVEAEGYEPGTPECNIAISMRIFLWVADHVKKASARLTPPFNPTRN